MKVKCRGYEGELISFNPRCEVTTYGDKYKKYLYDIEIALNSSDEIKISGASSEDIEFIKE